MKTQSESEDEVNCTVAQRANDSVVLERKRRQFNKKNPEENSDNEATPEVPGPTDDDKKNESRKAWTMEMLMNGGNISTNMMSEEESMSEVERMFL